ncbi:MAG: DUF4239 domain-containing protein [Bacteroidetes bacterium]|nr:DUF4239 domain-containing protein [Bacteroidota bacterium]
MAITYYMLQISPLLLFTLMILSAALFGGLLAFVFRTYLRVKVLRSHNEVTGFFFTTIASFYALLLGFVIFGVWGQLNDAQNNMSMEGSSALGLYRDIKFYPDTLESKQMMNEYLDFVSNVINEEIPNMAKMKASKKTPESFNNVFYKMEHLNPKNTFQIQLVSEMFNHLNQLAMYRGLRTASIDSEIPPPMWLPIMLGALITIICAVLVDIENKKIHIALTSLLSVYIAMFLFIIVMLDHPFTGSLSINPKSYKEVLNLEHLANGSTCHSITHINK